MPHDLFDADAHDDEDEPLTAPGAPVDVSALRTAAPAPTRQPPQRTAGRHDVTRRATFLVPEPLAQAARAERDQRSITLTELLMLILGETAQQLRTERAARARNRLGSGRRGRARTTGPTTGLQWMGPETDLDAIDQLVDELQMPSRNALVTAALQTWYDTEEAGAP